MHPTVISEARCATSLQVSIPATLVTCLMGKFLFYKTIGLLVPLRVRGFKLM